MSNALAKINWPPLPVLAQHDAGETVPAVKEDRLLTTKQVVVAVDSTVPTLYRWVAAGEFPPPDTRHGNRTFWKESTVELWLADRAAQESMHRKVTRPVWTPLVVMRAPDGRIVPIAQASKE